MAIPRYEEISRALGFATQTQLLLRCLHVILAAIVGLTYVAYSDNPAKFLIPRGRSLRGATVFLYAIPGVLPYILSILRGWKRDVETRKNLALVTLALVAGAAALMASISNFGPSPLDRAHLYAMIVCVTIFYAWVTTALTNSIDD